MPKLGIHYLKTISLLQMTVGQLILKIGATENCLETQNVALSVLIKLKTVVLIYIVFSIQIVMAISKHL